MVDRLQTRHRTQQSNARGQVQALRQPAPVTLHTPPGLLQPRLTIGPADDPYEREAERVADQVMRLPAPGIQRAPAQIQRCAKCAGKPIDEMCPSCAAKTRANHGLVQRAANGATPEVTPVIEGDIQSLRGGGQPLDAGVRSFMEPRFGYDFGGVRVHAGPQAARAASSVNALAFTLGNDVVFGAGQYQPGSDPGKRLIAHELTHVVQQRGTRSPTTLYSYRGKKGARYYGHEDTATLHEESFSAKKDKQKKPWIDLIEIVFDKVDYDSYGALPKGTLNVHYYGNQAALADFSLAILGGSAEHGFTTGGNHTVHRIEGVGYNQGGTYAPVDKDNAVGAASMHFAVFFHRGEAIHAGSLTEGSHGCVHVDWNSNPDWAKLQQINYHSVIGLTKVHVSYANPIVEQICCARSAYLGVKKRGSMKNPCDKIVPSACSTVTGSVAPATIQPRLTIGPVNDPYEREAERMADQIMRMPVPSIQRAPAQLQRAADGTTPEVTPAIEGQIQALRGGGQPLDGEVRSFMEPRFGYDFGGVRVHTGPQAARAASSVNALAFTLGSDVVFGAGQYQPGSAAGNRLIAHELTHVVQQGNIHGVPALQCYQIEGPWNKNDPVHETITEEALRKAGLLKPGQRFTDPGVWEYIRGVIWNDDPEGQLFDTAQNKTNNYSSGIAWYNKFSGAEKKATKGTRFGPKDDLMPRSHFGDLQFIHGMASQDTEPAALTQGKIMLWAEFTYKVAIGELTGTTKVGSVGISGIPELFPQLKDRTIAQMFGIAKIGDVNKRASGSLIHMIQDSYASGHAQREKLSGNKKGRVISFHSYTNQDHGKHGHDDAFQGKGSNVDKLAHVPGALDAVDRSAQILKFIKEKRSWDDVKLYLEMEVFGLVPNPMDAGSGNEYLKKAAPHKPAYAPPTLPSGAGDYELPKRNALEA